MKILIISDVESKYLWDYFVPSNFKDIELVISCGDLKSEYLSFLATVMSTPIFYIPGNHDEDYIKHPPGGCICIDNNIIEYKGIRILGLGGSHMYNNGLYQYTQNQMKRRFKRLRFKAWLNGGIDILVTHAPAYNIGDGQDSCHKGFQVFNEIMDKYSPKYLIHGHQHLNYGKSQRINIYNNTTVINAYEYFIFNY
ncbi:metallophosphoesterase [Clostridium sp. DJ247]|uniref:metallophosphoesterase family protein n=1 Tax=Clostridium sp. DJ247 TaxID=2726188 RepID=UPI001629C91D|nr:metallophosphoesterase [Clostridium sp. DJ247]MBC2582784.1 metallophosphoesterase [Clostridium sp. DJ247]